MIMNVEKRVFSINEFCARYGIGKTTAYEEIKANRLQVVKAGKRTLVPADAAELWLKSLPTAQVGS
jgi:excisionase family DNA binding protein